jgi:hypothetical protein
MHPQPELPIPADTILPVEEPDEPVTAWSLDELDEFSELGSLRSAWAEAGSRYA